MFSLILQDLEAQTKYRNYTFRNLHFLSGQTEWQ